MRRSPTSALHDLESVAERSVDEVVAVDVQHVEEERVERARGAGAVSESRPNELIVSWNACGRASSSTPIASPSSTTACTGKRRAQSTTPGNRPVISLRLRV